MRVLIVDDSSFMRKALSTVVSGDPELEVVGTARNGLEGVAMAIKLQPDVVTLDIEMPELDGLGALKRILAECSPAPAVIMCSSLTSQGSYEALKALRLGASDFICKETGSHYNDMNKMREEVITKIKVAGHSRRPTRANRASRPPPPAGGRPVAAPGPELPPTNDDKPLNLQGRSFDMLLIGSSTGGPPVLERMLTRLPKDLPFPIVIAQHMPLLFTQSMAKRLGELAALPVQHASNLMPLANGTCYVLPGGLHGRVVHATGTMPKLDISPEPTTAAYRPSVTELLSSGARVYGKRCLAVVLTGMGDDGCAGAKLLKEAGGMVLSQSQATSAVWGMPRAVAVAGVTDAMLSPESLADSIASLALSARRRQTMAA